MNDSIESTEPDFDEALLKAELELRGEEASNVKSELELAEFLQKRALRDSQLITRLSDDRFYDVWRTKIKSLMIDFVGCTCESNDDVPYAFREFSALVKIVEQELTTGLMKD